MGPALKSGRGFDEGDKGVLRDVLGELKREAGTAGGTEDLREIAANDVFERLGITLPDPRREVGIVYMRSARCATRCRVRHSTLGNSGV